MAISSRSGGQSGRDILGRGQQDERQQLVQLQARAGTTDQFVHKKAAHVIRVGRNVDHGRKAAHLALPILTVVVPLCRGGDFLWPGGGTLER
jgi:hypothetical protein